MRLDHLVIVARSLEQGVLAVERHLGVPLQPGGRHSLFGTHNALLSLGPDSYLEVIAVDPDAPEPSRTRWFGLDTPQMRERVAVAPALVHWVVRVPDLSGHEHAVELTRDHHRWSLTVPPDGSLPLDGAMPSLIQWHTPPPARTLIDRGVRLDRLVVTVPARDTLQLELGCLELDGLDIEEGQPGLRARLSTPAGEVDL
ncbi:VOC family protein [Actinomycetota bacterium]